MAEKRLLIVDDEPDFAEFVGIVGEQLGYETLKISDPRKFQDSYNEFTPDVIVLDMVMPEIDGVELIKWLTSQNATAKVVIISGYNPGRCNPGAIFHLRFCGFQRFDARFKFCAVRRIIR